MMLVDSTVWSLALRRRPTQLSPEERNLVACWAALVESGEVCLIGPIRQEILSGIRSEEQFTAIQERLGDFRYLDIQPLDYDQAARFFNACRAAGIAATPTEMLICAVAHRFRTPVFTTDRDFDRYAACLGTELYRPAEEPAASADDQPPS